MKKSLMIAAGLLAFVSIGANAQNWDKEPTSVFGLKLGEPIASSNIPDCPAYRPGYGLPSVMCVERPPGPYAEKMATLNVLPINEAYSGSINLSDGLVSSLHIEINHNNYANLRAILIERYGRPTKSDTSAVTSNGGVTLPAETSEWIGRTNSLRLFERFGSINKSLAAFTNNELTKKSGQKILDKVKDSASKF